MTAIRNMRAAVALALGCAAPYAAATNGDQMLGFTAIQNGMAGAVVAAPQDAATILINPAGLAELDIKEVRFDLGLGFLNPPREVNGFESDSNLYAMPGGAVAFRVNDKLTLGMGLGGLAGSGVDFADTSAAAPGNQMAVTTRQMFKVSPGFAYRINDALSVGATLNLNFQSMAMQGFNPLAASYWYLPQNQVYGWSASAGLIWKLNKQLQLGAAWTSKARMSDFEWNTAQGKVTMGIDGPQTLALGLAWKPMPGLLIEGDVKQIWFSKVMNSAIPTLPAGSPVPAAFNFGWSDQTVYALAVQKDIGDKMQVRAGFNYGKSPIGAEDVNSNVGAVAIVEKHLTLGLSRKFSDKATGSVSYVHGFEESMTSNVGAANTIKLKQNILNFQVSYQF